MTITQLYLNHCDEIESLDEKTADKYAFMKRIGFKGCFNLYFVDFAGYFGKSMLVYRNGHQIKYANDYELHHHLGWHRDWRSKEVRYEFFGNYNLIKSYLAKAKNTLFSDEEIFNEKIRSYDEYTRKLHYVINNAVLAFDHVTAIYITKEQEAEINEKLARLKNPVMAPMPIWSYVEGQEIADYLRNLFNAIKSQYHRLLEDNKVFREAISYELANHEACITCSAGEALGALGLSYRKLSPEKQIIVDQELRIQMRNYC